MSSILTPPLGNRKLRAIESRLTAILSPDVPRYVHEDYMLQVMDAPPPEELELSYLYTKSGQYEILTIEEVQNGNT